MIGVAGNDADVGPGLTSGSFLEFSVFLRALCASVLGLDSLKQHFA